MSKREPEGSISGQGIPKSVTVAISVGNRSIDATAPIQAVTKVVKSSDPDGEVKMRFRCKSRGLRAQASATSQPRKHLF